MSEYERTKERAGDAFYATSGTVVHGVHKDSKAAIERMAEDVKKQVEKREKYSRRRMHNDDEDINYINDRNAKFNKKLERFYGQYTKDIKKDIERGTAV
jgi:pre-mRNA-splicing factor SYF2